jgi:hypothetical protein
MWQKSKNTMGPNIDWSGYQLSMMSEQMYNGFLAANKRLTPIESKNKDNNKDKTKKRKS